MAPRVVEGLGLRSRSMEVKVERAPTTTTTTREATAIMTASLREIMEVTEEVIKVTKGGNTKVTQVTWRGIRIKVIMKVVKGENFTMLVTKVKVVMKVTTRGEVRWRTRLSMCCPHLEG